MTRMRLWLSAGIIACVVLVAFAFSVPHTRDLEVELEAPTTTTSVPALALHDAFKKGLHTISGSIEVPNACTPVSASATLAGDASSTQSILLAITFEIDSGVCLQVPTDVRFETTLSAPEGLPIDATVNGSPASTTAP